MGGGTACVYWDKHKPVTAHIKPIIQSPTIPTVKPITANITPIEINIKVILSGPHFHHKAGGIMLSFTFSR
jgi:hypothetical protein